MGSQVCRSIISRGTEGILIDIECHVSNNLPTIIIVGFASKAVNEAKDRLRGAFANSGLKLPRRRITLNLAPADLQKTDSGLDLAMAAAILSVDPQIRPLPDTAAIVGELGLDGRVRPVRGIIGKLLAARSQGVRTFFVPQANLDQARLIPGLSLFPVTNLLQFSRHLNGVQRITPVKTHSPPLDTARLAIPDTTPLDDIAGQTFAKRALVIAAAGGHSIFLLGPPGTGKSLLARTLSSLLPPLNHEEMLEVTQLQSLVGHNYEQLVTERPVRSPHHTASPTAMTGNAARPGEVSLSHRGVLLLDEFPEFSRSTLEVLRQPLEDRCINIANPHLSTTYPAHFLLAATANPCPCGFAGSTAAACTCNAAQLQRYRTKLSGPIFDRIDLCCTLSSIEHAKLIEAHSATDSRLLTEQITEARRLQATRYGNTSLLNSDLPHRLLRRFSHLSLEAAELLNQAADQVHLSARGYHKAIKVARTIADMEASPSIKIHHMSEALQYRLTPAKTLV